MAATLDPLHLTSALIIANPVAGAGRGAARAAELARELATAGVDVEVQLTSARGDATRMASQARAAAVVSVGGDGTLREVLCGLRDVELPVGILPLGTANVLGIDLRLPSDARGAARVLLEGHTVRMDTARVRDGLSFLAVSAGFDAEAVHRVDRDRRGPISKLSYIGAALGALVDLREPRLEVELDGARIPGTFGWVLASNVIRYAGVFRLAPERVLDDGLWEVYLFERAARRHMVLNALRAWSGRLPGSGARLLRARHVRIGASEPVPCQVDGDPAGTTPVELEVSGPRFRILCPRPPPGA